MHIKFTITDLVLQNFKISYGRWRDEKLAFSRIFDAFSYIAIDNICRGRIEIKNETSDQNKKIKAM